MLFSQNDYKYEHNSFEFIASDAIRFSNSMVWL